MDFKSFESPDPRPHNPLNQLLDDSEQAIAYGIFTDLFSYENHYNVLQNKYKGLASTWIVATFVAIGYVLSGYETGISVNIFLTIMFLTLISGVGIFLIWFLDAGVYYKFVESIFVEVLSLEDKYPILGSSHHNVLKLHKLEHDPHTFHGFFYSSFILFLLSTSAICLSIYLYEINKVYFSIVVSMTVIGWIIFGALRNKALQINNRH